MLALNLPAPAPFELLSGPHAVALPGAAAPLAAAATTAGGTPDGGLPAVLSPVLILVLCFVAGIGTVLLLPGRREGMIRRIGGAVVLVAALIFAGLIVRAAGTAVSLSQIYFWAFTAVALGGAVRVVTHPKPVYSALYFVLTVFASAGLFVLLWAEFMAAALVLIYAGAILITYVFVIMLASQATGEGTGAADKDGPGAGGGGVAAVTEYDNVSREPVVAAAVGFALMGMLLFVIFDKAHSIQKQTPRDPAMSTGMAQVDQPYRGSTQQIGYYLFSNQLVNLELAGLILTISMVGAIVIARRRVLSTEPIGASVGKGPGETMVGPATPISDDPFSIPVYGTDNPRQKAYPET